LERETSLGSRSSSASDDHSIRSARAIKVFGDLVHDENSLSYSPSPMKSKKLGLRNITNVCDSSPSAARILPFGEIQFTTAKKNLRKSSTGSKIDTKIDEKKDKADNDDGKKKKFSNGKKNSSVKNVVISTRPTSASSSTSKSSSKSATTRTASTTASLSIASKEVHTRKRNIVNSSKVVPVKRHVTESKYRSNASSSTRKAQASKAQNAIKDATQSVNQTLNASRIAKIGHHHNVAAEVSMLREEWLAEKEEAAMFYNEVEKTRREMLDLRSQLSSQYAQNKVEHERTQLQRRMNELDKEIQFKSDVFVQHKQKLKENEDRRRRMSSGLKKDMWNTRRAASARIEMERIEEQHELLEHKWAGERDADAYLKQCAQERRESFAFRNVDGRRQRVEQAERQEEEKHQEHEMIEHKWAGEEDAKKYLEQCAQERRNSFAFRNADGRRQRTEEVEMREQTQITEHNSYELKWAGERDAEEYLKDCQQARRESFAFRNVEGRRQRQEEEEHKAQKGMIEHKGYEHKWGGEEDAKMYLDQCAKERRDSFAFRNLDGRRQRVEEENRDADEKLAEHKSLEHKWAGERDAEDYTKKCENARRESFAFRGCEVVRHRAVMEELRNIANEKEHESHVLKWAAQDDVKDYLGKISEERRQSLVVRNQEGVRHRDLEEVWRCEELQREHELEMARSASKSYSCNCHSFH